jgi:hypothetical protein
MRPAAPVTALAALLSFGLLAACSRLSSFAVPLSEDTGAYLYIGQVILDGGAPYADAADNKGPLTYLLFAAIDAVSGSSTATVRATLVLFTALAAVAVGAYVLRAGGRLAAGVAGAAMAILGSAEVLEGNDPNTEQYAVAPLAGAWLLAARGGERAAAASGALAAAAALLNVGFVAVLPVLALELWRSGEAASRARRYAFFAGGAVAAVAPFLTWLGLAGALDDAWTQVAGTAFDTIGGEPSGGTLFDTGPLWEVPG